MKALRSAGVSVHIRRVCTSSMHMHMHRHQKSVSLWRMKALRSAGVRVAVCHRSAWVPVVRD